MQKGVNIYLVELTAAENPNSRPQGAPRPSGKNSDSKMRLSLDYSTIAIRTETKTHK